MGGKQRKVRAAAVPGGPQRMRRTRRQPHLSAPGRGKWQPGAEQQG
jgi:hypothetical protein